MTPIAHSPQRPAARARRVPPGRVSRLGAGAALALALPLVGAAGQARERRPAPPPAAAARARPAAPARTGGEPPAAADTARGPDSAATEVVALSTPVVAEPGLVDRMKARVLAFFYWVRALVGGEPPPVLPAPGAAVATADTATLPARRLLVGTWAHGDRKSSLGDSLTLELREDGGARLAERRFSLDGTNRWALARPQRQGSWLVRRRPGAQAELCITWHSPAPPVATCERVVPDSVPSGRMITYGGRHWREQPVAPPKRARSKDRRLAGRG